MVPTVNIVSISIWQQGTKSDLYALDAAIRIVPMAESEYPSILDTEEFWGEIG